WDDYRLIFLCRVKSACGYWRIGNRMDMNIRTGHITYQTGCILYSIDEIIIAIEIEARCIPDHSGSLINNLSIVRLLNNGEGFGQYIIINIICKDIEGYRSVLICSSKIVNSKW